MSINKSPLRQHIEARMQLNQGIRAFLKQRNVLEVETPILSRFGNTDPAIESFVTQAQDASSAAGAQAARWLRTSPEFFHKRLLSMGSGDIFELAKVFRAGEVSARHHPEFSMLEYYRLGFDEFDLMADLAQLMQCLQRQFNQPVWPIHHLRFDDWFQAQLSINLQQIAPEQLLEVAKQHGAQSALDTDGCIDFLRSHVLEPALDPAAWIFIHDFPASQAALAKLSHDGLFARRFELFGGGFELANGYFELCNASEQQLRFAKDLEKRRDNRQSEIPIDSQLLAALAEGLPSCAGVAVGLDRVLMLLTNAQDIADVMLLSER